MSTQPNVNAQVMRTALIAAAAAASISAVSSTLVVFAVAQLLRTTPRTRPHRRRSRAASAAHRTRPSDVAMDTSTAHTRRQSSLFAWCLRRLSGRVTSSDSDDTSDEEAVADELAGSQMASARATPTRVAIRDTPLGKDLLSASGPAAVAAVAAAAAKHGVRRSTLDSKGPRAYHTHEGGIITQYMDATARLETDEYFKKNATQRRDTVALAERRQRRRSSALAKPDVGAMDLAVFDVTACAGLPIAPSSVPTGAGARVHPVASMLAQVGFDDVDSSTGGGGCGIVGGGRQASSSLSLLSASAAMPLPQNPIYRVVITGGPCSGKSSSMTFLKAEMERVGYAVYLVPEVATLLMMGGARLWLTPEEAKEEEEEEEAKAQRAAIIRTYQQRIAKLEMVMAATPSDSDAENVYGERGAHLTAAKTSAYSSQMDAGTNGSRAAGDHTAATPRLSRKKITMQRVVLQLMMMLEDCFYELAAMRGKPCVIFYDRGTMDGSAYCTDAEWAEILRVTGYTDEELRDTRYDAVVHLVTAALGAEAYYTLENNATRHETAEEAIAQDMATRNVWRGHFLFYVCDNSTNFETKLERVAAFVRKVIGVSPVSSPTVSGASLSTLGVPTDLQELAYIMTGTRAANKHVLLSTSNSRERSLSPSMGLSMNGTPQSGQLQPPGDSMGLDHSVLLDVNATTVGTTLMPASAKASTRPRGPAPTVRGVTGDPSVVSPVASRGDGVSEAAEAVLHSPVSVVPAFADDDSISLHSHSCREADVRMTPPHTTTSAEAAHPEVPAPRSASEEAGAEDMARPNRRRLTLPPSDLAAATAAAAMAERRAARSEAKSEGDGVSASPSPSPDIPENARTEMAPVSQSASAAAAAAAAALSRGSRRHDFSASLTLNADDLRQQDGTHGLNGSVLAENAVSRHAGTATTFAESAAEGLQRHFMIRAIDVTHIPDNAVESEITLITLVPTRREYVSETIIRVAREGASSPTRPVYMRRVEFARHAKRSGVVAATALSSPLSPAEEAAAGGDERSHAVRNVTTRALSREDFLRLAQFFDPAQPLVRKQVKRFLHGFHQLSVVSFLEPEELRGSSRLICSAEVSADELPDWIQVEEVSLTGRDVLV